MKKTAFLLFLLVAFINALPANQLQESETTQDTVNATPESQIQTINNLRYDFTPEEIEELKANARNRSEQMIENYENMNFHRRGMPPQVRNRGSRQNCSSGRTGRRGRLSNIDLSPTQQAKIDELKTKYRSDVANIRAELQKLHIDKQTAIRNDNYRQANKIIDKIKKAEADIEKLRLKHYENIQKELTPVQR